MGALFDGMQARVRLLEGLQGAGVEEAPGELDQAGRNGVQLAVEVNGKAAVHQVGITPRQGDPIEVETGIVPTPRIPVFGTCAGMILLSSGGESMMEGQATLGILDAKVIRNAYGRQTDSFEADLDIPAIGKEPFHGVFIRAPAFEKVWGRCKSLATHQGNIVLARQDNILAASFHPELTSDTRVHEYFLEMI